MTAPGIVRTMRRRDGDLAATLYGQCFDAPWERGWSREEFARLLAMPGCFGLLLITDGRPTGLAMARVAADEAEVLTLGVVPHMRRRGGASLLLSRLRQRCRRRGARRLFLEVAQDNLPASSLYKASGFTIVGHRAGYFDRGSQGRIAALVMRLDLGKTRKTS
ncbi:MAG: GNAT family N-acetyltransferase [Alphaproteobacteria bacterium]|nr:GNAT family N-acetyltransferase [Alphaproteobacteria bacterium]